MMETLEDDGDDGDEGAGGDEEDEEDKEGSSIHTDDYKPLVRQMSFDP